MFKRILVPLDGSKTAESVVPVVIEEARLHGAVVVLLRVIAPLRQSLMLSASSINQAFQQVEVIARDYLEGVAATFRESNVEVELIVEHGQPAQRTLEIAEDIECDLIVIGTHGETGSFQWRFGSVANKIVKTKTSMPVLVITTE